MWERNGREWERTGRDGSVSRRFVSDWKRFSRGYRPICVPVLACPVFSPWYVAGFPCLLGICGRHAQESPLIPVLHETVTRGFGDGQRRSPPVSASPPSALAVRKPSILACCGYWDMRTMIPYRRKAEYSGMGSYVRGCLGVSRCPGFLHGRILSRRLTYSSTSRFSSDLPMV